MKLISVLLLMVVLLPRPTRAGQVFAGSLEDKSCLRITAETDLLPRNYADANWKDYLRNAESASREILHYVTAIRSREIGR